MTALTGTGIASIGELLVEFVCSGKDGHHRRAGLYSGPYPSGSAGIFIDQAARCGGRAIFVGAVGGDAFGHIILDRFAADSVDTSLIATVADRPTGTAFVSYNSDGSRDFVFNIAHSAAAQFGASEAALDRLMSFGTGIIHVSGSALPDEAMGGKILHLCRELRDRGVRISFDPNVRKELLDNSTYFWAVNELMGLCTYFLPSEEDAAILFPGLGLADYAAKLFAGNAEYVVLKRGEKGAAGISRGGEQHGFAAHQVDVTDPTGAGDCFCATFVTLIGPGGVSFREALRHANAAGALAVRKLGPMEGNCTLAEIRAFLWRASMTAAILRDIVARNRAGVHAGIPSYCTAHRETLQAIFRFYRGNNDTILIEATCNQVNQQSGYTGLTPAGFRGFVRDLALGEGIDGRRIILGGDHLGPNPWKAETADAAMAKACVLVRDYAGAGFSKIHLDASMACADDHALSEEMIAARAAELCAVAEEHAVGAPPVYIIGTEVPRPGGETENLESLGVTRPDAPVRTYELHREAFNARGLAGALERVVAIVVQPGVDFGNNQVFAFDKVAARDLSAAIGKIPGAVFEAHSTDYQTPGSLHDLVASHFAILKVGPELTAAYREAVVAMAMIEFWLPVLGKSEILNRIADVMNGDPRYWRDYVADGPRGDLERLFGLSDRIRYYWPKEAIQAALTILYANIDAGHGETGLLSQFAGLPIGGTDGGLALSRQIIQARVGAVAAKYCSAC